MIKTIIIIAILSLGVTFNSYADESDRIDQLEKEVQELKLRISKLENLLNDSSVSNELASSHEGWKSVSNWRKLTTGMNADDVRKLLGEPQRVDGGDFADWYYENGGIVMFAFGNVNRWKEPRN